MQSCLRSSFLTPMETIAILLPIVLLFLWSRVILTCPPPPNQSNDYNVHDSWVLLATRLNATHVYYMKRAARCRLSCSPTPTKSNASWVLLATRLLAIRVYYRKRAARCRLGQSPDIRPRHHSVPNLISIKETRRLRPWHSCNSITHPRESIE
jgi:hypothetical protein